MTYEECCNLWGKEMQFYDISDDCDESLISRLLVVAANFRKSLGIWENLSQLLAIYFQWRIWVLTVIKNTIFISFAFLYFRQNVSFPTSYCYIKIALFVYFTCLNNLTDGFRDTRYILKIDIFEILFRVSNDVTIFLDKFNWHMWGR